jgi:predicted metal-binding membrane protein
VAPARRVREGLSAFAGASAVLFAAGAAAAIGWSKSMPALCGGPLTAWLPLPGQTWAGAAASFLAMWAVMMIPMMMPSLAPALWRYRQAVADAGAARWAPLTAIAGAGYFVVWALLGLAVYPLGVLFSEAGTPRFAAGAVVLGAGLVQLSAWKRKHLVCCREGTDCCAELPADAPAAWLHGMHLGVRCVLCCGNVMAILLVAGVMDLVPMAAVAAAITLERLVPAGVRVAQGIGVVIVGAGLFLLARAAGW